MRADGRNDLACVITRRGGFRSWAKKANTTMKAHTCDFYLLLCYTKNGKYQDSFTPLLG